LLNNTFEEYDDEEFRSYPVKESNLFNGKKRSEITNILNQYLEPPTEMKRDYSKKSLNLGEYDDPMFLQRTSFNYMQDEDEESK
jgi:hypothetical protein